MTLKKSEKLLNLIVLGMHRSGTSLASGLLRIAGVYFGTDDEFIAPNDENPKGFLERKDIRSLNDRMLHSVGADWSEIADFDLSRMANDQRFGFLSEAGTILSGMRHLYQTQHGKSSCRHP